MSWKDFEHVVKALTPRNSDELNVVREMLRRAALFREAHPEFFATEESRAYFHSLVEALEVYKSIHGESVPIDTINDTILREIRQIRDYCHLQEGRASVY